MENNRISQTDMEEMIRRFKEEAMAYRQRSGLYQELIPAQQVSAAPEADSVRPRQESDMPEESVQAKIPEDGSPTGAQFLRTGEENATQELDDVLYTDGAVSIDELVRDSRFQRSETPYTDTGQLQVEVSAAERSLPVPFSDVLVIRKAEGEQELIQSLQTDNSGKTPVINLPAPSRTLSEQPEPNTVRPYGVYTVMVSHPDYYTTIIRDVQVFAGQRSILPVNLIPLSEGGRNAASSNVDITTDRHNLNE